MEQDLLTSPKMVSTASPTYKNLRNLQRHSPVEVKEKLRKDYKQRIHKCRNQLLNGLRGVVNETSLRTSLSAVWSEMFGSDLEHGLDEEHKLFDEIREEIMQAELNWLLEEYDKSQFANIDWSTMERNTDVICPICQKENLTTVSNNVSCKKCAFCIATVQNLTQIRNEIMNSVERHGRNCASDAQFIVIPDGNDPHVYLICHCCSEMQIIF